MEGKKTRGRPRMMPLDGMMEEEYSKLKQKARKRDEMRNWKYEPAYRKAENQKKIVKNDK